MDIREHLISKSAETQAVEEYLSFLIGCPQLKEGGERHHILPRCVYPEFVSFKLNPWNIQRLSSRDHFIAHFKLCTVFPDNPLVYLAWTMMTRGRDMTKEISELADEYAEAKARVLHYLKTRKISEVTRTKQSASSKKRYEDPAARAKTAESSRGRRMSDANKEALRRALLHRPKSEEHKQKLRDKLVTDAARENMSRAQKRRYSDPEQREIARTLNLGRKPTEETKKKMSKSGKNRPPRSAETRAKLSAALMGHGMSAEGRAKMSTAAKLERVGKKWICKDGVIRFVKPDQVLALLADGWRLGRK